MDTADIILRAALVGMGGTIVLDLYAFLMQIVPTSYPQEPSGPITVQNHIT
jgi:hypothetical protein